MNDFQEFIEIIRDFIRLFETLIPLEQEKLDAAVKNRVSFVEDCMNKEQAAVLRLRGLEQKRENAQKKLGMENLTFRQILEKAPEDVVPVLRPLFNELSGQVQMFRELSGSVKDAIEINLHVIQSTLAASQTPNTYTPPTKKAADGTKPHFTSRSV